MRKSALAIVLANLQLNSSSPEVRRQAIELLGRQMILKLRRACNHSPRLNMNPMPACVLPLAKV